MGTTANNAWPYPDPASPPNAPAQIQALADAIDADITDTGWQLVPIADARITAYGAGSEPRYRVKNGMCTITGQLTTSTAGLIDSGLTWCTNLAVVARPSLQMHSVQQGSGDDRWALIVKTNGGITAERWGPSTSPAGVWLPFTITYLVG